MMKRLLLCLICFSAFTATQAQDSLHVKPQVSAPYKWAVGLRYAPGGPTGADLNMTAKYFVTPQSALELQSTLSPEARYYIASLSYIWQPKLATSERLRPYAGIGMGIIRPDNSLYHNNEPTRSNLVVIPSFGVEYSFKKIPLAISLDYRSTFMRIGGGSSYLNLNNTSNIGLGLKYTFR